MEYGAYELRLGRADCDEEEPACSACSLYESVPADLLAANVGRWGWCPDQGCYVCGTDEVSGSACSGTAYKAGGWA